MNELLEKIINNPKNKAVIQFLDIDFTEKPFHFLNWEKSRSGFDEGGLALFDRFGKNIPIENKYSLGLNNIMVCLKTGEIFAFHTGRYSLFFKCDFEYHGLTNSDNYRKGYTFDCISDITELGGNWAFMDKFNGTESQQLERAYEIIRKTKC